MGPYLGDVVEDEVVSSILNSQESILENKTGWSSDDLNPD